MWLQVVLPYWRPLKVTKQIQRHRLLHPDKPPVVIPPEQLRFIQDESASKCCGFDFDTRRFLRAVFDFVFRWASCLVTLLSLPVRCYIAFVAGAFEP